MASTKMSCIVAKLSTVGANFYELLHIECGGDNQHLKKDPLITNQIKNKRHGEISIIKMLKPNL